VSLSTEGLFYCVRTSDEFTVRMCMKESEVSASKAATAATNDVYDYDDDEDPQSFSETY